VKQAEQASPQQPHRQRSGRQMMNRQHRSTTNTIRTMIPTPNTTGDPLRTSSIETQLIALCLQRNGFDRWKRTVQTRTAQLQKLIYRKLKKHLESIDKEDRLAVERRWKRILTRGGPRRLQKLREFIKWLGNFRD